jgi:GxxExxY protein
MTQISTDRNDAETYAIIGAAMEVHSTLGSGFLEAVYNEAMAVALQLRGIPFEREVALPLRYKDRLLRCVYRDDLTVFKNIVVEIKALSGLGGVEQAQIISYLKAIRER